MQNEFFVVFGCTKSTMGSAAIHLIIVGTAAIHPIAAAAAMISAAEQSVFFVQLRCVI